MQWPKYQGAAKGGAIKGGVYMHARTHANKRAQMQTNADVRLSEIDPKTERNVRKREQTQTNANKLRKMQSSSLFVGLIF